MMQQLILRLTNPFPAVSAIIFENRFISEVYYMHYALRRCACVITAWWLGFVFHSYGMIHWLMAALSVFTLQPTLSIHCHWHSTLMRFTQIKDNQSVKAGTLHCDPMLICWLVRACKRCCGGRLTGASPRDAEQASNRFRGGDR